MKVLLTGGRAPATLDLARLFHQAGWTVYIADSCNAPISKGSAAVTHTFLVSPPKHDRTAFIKGLAQLINAHQIDLLVPTCEEVFYVAQGQAQLPCRVFTDTFSKLAALHHKGRFTEYIASFTLQAPETHWIKNAADLIPWLSGERGPDWVFKPVFSRFAAFVLIKPGYPQLIHLQQRLSTMNHNPELHAWIAQRYVPGQEYSTYSVAQQGRLLAHVTYQSKYRAGKGSGIYFIAVEMPIITAFVAEFVQTLHYTGQVAFDIRVMPDGRAFVLECNPRATSGLHLLAGMPELIEAFKRFDATMNISANQPVVTPLVGTQRMLGLIMPLYCRGYRWIKDWLNTPDAVFHRCDPVPFFYQLVSFAEVAFNSWRRKISLIEAATADLEWNGDV